MNNIDTMPMFDERVYIVYGDEESYGEYVRTDEDGFYQFKDLTKGNYSVYTYSADTSTAANYINGLAIKDEIDVEITENNEIVEAPLIHIIAFP